MKIQIQGNGEGIAIKPNSWEKRVLYKTIKNVGVA